MLIIPIVVKKRKCTNSNKFLILSFTIPSPLYRHHISYHKYCTNFMKKSNQWIFSSRYRKQRTSITIRRRRRYFTRNRWRWRHFTWRFACWWVGWNRTLNFRSHQNYQHVSPLCRTTSVYSCTIQHSAGLVSLQHHSRPAVSCELLHTTHQ